ncbi:hypothetical protein [Flavobacterium sp. KMS]|uniref:hypothetical protein n=1 Tax=Flavobacterium sp. KMS TaxID=1566023 RepID=UPI000AF54E12|nr:hypothetical protein [Flavobacterium sp. KMS]
MKYILTLLITLLSYNMHSQNIIGEYWRISEIIGQDTNYTQEFVLQKMDKDDKPYSMYGNRIFFDKNNTFKCSYSATCGNDCFPSSVGTYKLIDNKHIEIDINEFSQTGDCEQKKIALNLKLRYYISQKTDKIIKLIKSDGNIFQDNLNEKYSLMVDNYREEVKNGSFDLLNFKTNQKDNFLRVNAYIKNKTKIKNYKILYTQKLDGTFLINLVQNEDAENDYFYIINAFVDNFEYNVGYYKLKKK